MSAGVNVQKNSLWKLCENCMQTVSHFLGNCSLTSSLFGVLDATDILSTLLNSNSTGYKATSYNSRIQTQAIKMLPVLEFKFFSEAALSNIRKASNILKLYVIYLTVLVS